MIDLKSIAEHLNVNATTFTKAYNSAPHAAKRPTGQAWPAQSSDEPSRALLYAVVVTLKPAHVLELGTGYGASATMITDALIANGSGHLTSVDIRDRMEGGKLAIGQLIPAANRAVLTLVHSDAAAYLEKTDTVWDLIIEDTDHTKDTTKRLWELALKKVKPDGVIMCHDATHPGVGEAVMAGIHAAGVSEPVLSGGRYGYALHRVVEQAAPKKKTTTRRRSTRKKTEPKT